MTGLSLSLRSRLLAGMAVVALVLVCVAVVITRSTYSYLLDQVDAQLETVGGPRGFGGNSPPPEMMDPDSAQQPLSTVFIANIDSNGTVRVLATPGLQSDDPPIPDVDVATATRNAITGDPYTVGSTVDGERYRLRADVSPVTGDLMVVGLSLSNVDAAVGRLVTVEIVATLTVLAVLSLVTWWVIRLGVRPIKRMTAAASMIAGGDLSHRVPDEATGTEAGDLGIALNQMLGRIETAFDERAESEARLRRFVADASHELRTPVTTIRGYGELYRMGGLEQADQLDEAMRRTEQEATRMGNLVADMLQLARLDQGRDLQMLPVRLDLVAADAAADARAVQPDRHITTDLTPTTVLGDEERLRQVAANLLGNALEHTPLDADITVTVSASDRGSGGGSGGDTGPATLTIADRGPGMDAEAVAHAFERFYRADPSRSRHQGGSGLGLSIVESIVTAHGGTVSMTSEQGIGTSVAVTLPVHEGGDPAPT